MENSNDLNLIIFYFIEDCEWEPSNNSSPQTSINDGKEARIFNDSRYSIIDAFHELEV